MPKLTLDKLESFLWSAADILRGIRKIIINNHMSLLLATLS